MPMTTQRAFWRLSFREALAMESHPPYYTVDSLNEGQFICNNSSCPTDDTYREHIRKMALTVRRDGPGSNFTLKHQQDRDIDNLSASAVRYALGRATYVVGEVAGIVERNVDALSWNTIQTIIKDIDDAWQQDRLGRTADEVVWKRLSDTLAKRPKPLGTF